MHPADIMKNMICRVHYFYARDLLLSRISRPHFPLTACASYKKNLYFFDVSY